MGRALLAFAALALSACMGERAPAGCAISVESTLAFTGEGAADIVTARSFGAACEQAIGLYTVTTAEGDPVWAFAAPLARAFGDDFAEPTPEGMRAFLARWAEPERGATAQAPAWSDLAAGQTTLDRLTYEDIRARNLPMLCHFSGTARQLCVFWEPAAAGAGHFYDRDIAQEHETP